MTTDQSQVRRDERARLAGVLDRLQAGAPGALQLVGEAGIGKSFLLDELVQQARGRGVLVLVGRAAELGIEPPFAVFAEAIESALPQGADLDGLDAETREVLRATVPALAVDEEPAGAVAGYRVSRAVRALLSAWAQRRPVLLALDDVHWADEESLAVLAYLLRHPPAGRVLIALSHRLPGLPASVEAALGQAHVESVQLEPLPFDEARALLPAGLGEREARRLWYDSGGNPLYLRELARQAHRAEEDVDVARLAMLPPGVPTVVATAVGHELTGLRADASAWELLQAAAVLGDRFDVTVAIEVAGLEEPVGLSAVDLLVARDLLRVDEFTGRLRFRHPRRVARGLPPHR